MNIYKATAFFLFTAPSTDAWTSWKPSSRSWSRNSVVVESAEPDVMEGATAFENWFRSVPGAECIPEVSHANFGNLRGLSLSSKGKETWKSSGELNLLKVPKSIVLSTDLTQSDWDATLAQKLWIECMKGPSSSIAGYVALLTRGWSPVDLPLLPPTTAPDALRHWTDEEKRMLVNHEAAAAAVAAGQKVLQLLDQQNQLWYDKFSKVKGMTFEQFQWAMEVVHSRAFCGSFGVGSSPIPPIVTATVPVVAAVAGLIHYNNNPSPSDALLVGLGLVACAPAIFNSFNESPPVAVLLPMIDSINHLEEADSNIQYSALSNAFTLSVGKKCVVDENEKTQLFVSYGKKKDTELLLNYGFLRDVSSKGDVRTRRKALAEAFLLRQT